MKTFAIFLSLIFFTLTVNSQWIQQTSGTTADLTDIWMFSTDKVIVCGDLGTVLKTTNSGASWNQMQSNSAEWLGYIFFLNENTGWILGDDSLHKTVDGGSTWTGISAVTGRSVFFADASTGWIAGSNSSIKKTTNGGINWIAYQLPNPSIAANLFFINSNTGYSMGTRPVQDSTVIYKTTNGGNNWVVFHRDDVIYYSMFVLNESNLYFCGFDGAFTKTNDGGISWGGVNTPSTETLKKIVFTDAMTGYACGNYGEIYVTYDGGQSWQSQSKEIDESFQSIAFLPSNNQIGYLVATGGLIYKTTNGGVIGINPISSEVPSGYSLSQNYPNPFNPVTNINFSIPKSGNVKLVVFDVTGKEVAELVNENLNAGTYNYDFNSSHLSSGVYFYKLVTSEFTDVKKMLMVK